MFYFYQSILSLGKKRKNQKKEILEKWESNKMGLGAVITLCYRATSPRSSASEISSARNRNAIQRRLALVVQMPDGRLLVAA